MDAPNVVPFLKSESLFQSFMLWWFFAVLFKLIAFRIFFLPTWHDVFEAIAERIHWKADHIKDFVCHKRRARFSKCAKRCARRAGRCQYEQALEQSRKECSVHRVASQFYKMHLPPPLPFMKRRKPVIEKKDEGEDEKNLSASNETMASPTPMLKRASMSKTALIDLARMQQWSVITDRKLHRREAKYRDSDGLYPLHWACSGGPPVEVVQILLQTYSSAAKKVDYEGSTALHFASHYSASAAVMETLLKVFAKAVGMQDKYGRSPLYHAVDKAASLEVLKLLVKADPSMSITPCLPTEARSLPLTRATAVRTPLFIVWSAVVADRQCRKDLRGRKWDKAQLLLEAAYQYMSDLNPSIPRSYRLLNSSIVMDVYLPEQVVALAILAKSDQLQERDERGQVPLALVASTRQYSPERSHELVQLLLKSYPPAAMERDNKGRSSLTLAAESGKQLDWGLEDLLDADPDALSELDGLTGLPPALVAATAVSETVPIEEQVHATGAAQDPYNLLSPKQHEWLDRHNGRRSLRKLLSFEDRETEQSNTIYTLLRKDPAVMAWNA